jgi:hypothetical protein
MSLGFWACVIWAIIETVVKADNYWVRFNVAMACIGLDILGLLWLSVVLLVKYISNNNDTRSATINQAPTDAVTQPVIATPLVIPWLIVEVQVDDLVHECDVSEDWESWTNDDRKSWM